MPLSLQEISDRLEIQQLMVDYSTAIDNKDFDALDHVFVPDAYIDYRVMGGIDGQFPDLKAWLKQVMQIFPHTQHMIANMSISLCAQRKVGALLSVLKSVVMITTSPVV